MRVSILETLILIYSVGGEYVILEYVLKFFLPLQYVFKLFLDYFFILQAIVKTSVE